MAEIVNRDRYVRCEDVSTTLQRRCAAAALCSCLCACGLVSIGRPADTLWHHAYTLVIISSAFASLGEGNVAAINAQSISMTINFIVDHGRGRHSILRSVLALSNMRICYD